MKNRSAPTPDAHHRRKDMLVREFVLIVKDPGTTDIDKTQTTIRPILAARGLVVLESDEDDEGNPTFLLRGDADASDLGSVRRERTYEPWDSEGVS
jgi:hypothetical protein